MGMSAAAVILPPRDKFRFAMLEASRAVRDPSCKLYTDGHRLAWLPNPLPGWYRTGAADVSDAYEQTDRTAGCCDIGAAA
jgi:hypothetical protein